MCSKLCCLFLIIELPILSRPLQEEPDSFTNEYMMLTLYRWDPSKGDSGDGPIRTYVVKTCQSKSYDGCL